MNDTPRIYRLSGKFRCKNCGSTEVAIRHYMTNKTSVTFNQHGGLEELRLEEKESQLHIECQLCRHKTARDGNMSEVFSDSVLPH